MATDRIVIFKDEIPKEQDLRFMLEDYLGSAGEIDCKGNLWIVVLPGKASFPFKRVCPELADRQNMYLEERWFEVDVGSLHEDKTEEIYGGPCIDVMTRLQDEFTNNIADGFTKLVARYYKAELDAEMD